MSRLSDDYTPGGGSAASSIPTNWVSWSLAPPATALTGTAPGPYYYTAADIELGFQPGTDFFTDDRVWVPGGQTSGGIGSVGGGIFEIAAYVGTPEAVLDEGSAAQRFLWSGASAGSLGGAIGGLGGLGYDVTIPVLQMWAGATSNRSTPSYTAPDGGVLHDIFSKLLGGFGTDALSIGDGLISGYIWQVGPPPA